MTADVPAIVTVYIAGTSHSFEGYTTPKGCKPLKLEPMTDAQRNPVIVKVACRLAKR